MASTLSSNKFLSHVFYFNKYNDKVRVLDLVQLVDDLEVQYYLYIVF